MDRIEVYFKEAPTYLASNSQQLVILINGQPLSDMLLELGVCSADEGGADGGSEKPSHAWLLREDCEIQHLKSGRTLIMGCTCGIPWCAPLEVEVTIRNGMVIWSGFTNTPMQEKSVTNLGPFVFDQAEYELAVNKAFGQQNTTLRADFPHGSR